MNAISISADMITPHTSTVQPTVPTATMMTSLVPSITPINIKQSKPIMVAGVAVGAIAFIIIVITITTVIVVKYRQSHTPGRSCERKTVAPLPVPDVRYIAKLHSCVRTKFYAIILLLCRMLPYPRGPKSTLSRYSKLFIYFPARASTYLKLDIKYFLHI